MKTNVNIVMAKPLLESASEKLVEFLDFCFVDPDSGIGWIEPSSEDMKKLWDFQRDNPKEGRNIQYIIDSVKKTPCGLKFILDTVPNQYFGEEYR